MHKKINLCTPPTLWCIQYSWMSLAQWHEATCYQLDSPICNLNAKSTLATQLLSGCSLPPHPQQLFLPAVHLPAMKARETGTPLRAKWLLNTQAYQPHTHKPKPDEWIASNYASKQHSSRSLTINRTNKQLIRFLHNHGNLTIVTTKIMNCPLSPT